MLAMADGKAMILTVLRCYTIYVREYVRCYTIKCQGCCSCIVYVSRYGLGVTISRHVSMVSMDTPADML